MINAVANRAAVSVTDGLPRAATSVTASNTNTIALSQQPVRLQRVPWQARRVVCRQKKGETPTRPNRCADTGAVRSETNTCTIMRTN
jgi:hypothetical protein